MKKRIKTIRMLFALVALFSVNLSHAGSASTSYGTTYANVPYSINNAVTGYVEVSVDSYYYGDAWARICPKNDGEFLSVYTDSYSGSGYLYAEFIGGPGLYQLDAISSGSGSAFAYISW